MRIRKGGTAGGSRGSAGISPVVAGASLSRTRQILRLQGKRVLPHFFCKIGLCIPREGRLFYARLRDGILEEARRFESLVPGNGHGLPP